MSGRQIKRKRRTLAQFTGDLELAAMRLHQLTGNSQSQSTAAAAMGTGPVAAPETVKDKGQVIRRDPFTAVGNRDTYTAVDGGCAQRDRSVGWRVAECVVHQVAQHLVKPPSVTIHQE